MTELINTLNEIKRSKMSLREILIEDITKTINATDEQWVWARDFKPADPLPDFESMSDSELLTAYKKASQRASIPMG